MHRFYKTMALAMFGLLPLGAQAAPLTIVNVGAPAINCVFNATCTVVVTDSIGNFTPPGDSGNGRVQSRTYPGLAPAPMAGKMAYVYRVDMTGVSGSTCVNAIQFTFGPIVQSPNYKPGTVADMFVVTSGGLGSVVVETATKAGAPGIVVANFSGSGVCPGQTSYFFGLTSATTTPVPSTVKLFYTPAASATTEIRVP